MEGKLIENYVGRIGKMKKEFFFRVVSVLLPPHINRTVSISRMPQLHKKQSKFLDFLWFSLLQKLAVSENRIIMSVCGWAG